MGKQTPFRFYTLVINLILLVTLACKAQPAAAQPDDFPQANAWYQATPSVVWCNDPTSTTTLEVHIINRNEVSRVWLTNLGTDEEEERAELFDDGTHGDATAGDGVYTLSEVVLPCNPVMYNFEIGYSNWLGFLRVELKDGSMRGNNYGMTVGLVHQKYKDAFAVQDFGEGLSATAYAFFIEDTNHEIIESYPVSDVYCGKSNYKAYQKFYSVMPDDFDIAVVMPGMQIFRQSDLAENVPYAVAVSNSIENIGWEIFSDAAQFGSAGRLRSAIYNSFGSIDVLDHELGHVWMVGIGQSIGLMNETYSPVIMGHWNKMADVQGQMGYYYIDDSGAIGHFAYNGDETWHLVPNTTVEPYSPLELYLMGLIPPEEVPDVHILENPDLSDPQRITAASYKTVTIEELMQSTGGERIPSYKDSQKEFNLAFIVTQDKPYNDAAYAFFSLLAHRISSVDEPKRYSSFAPFYWATGGQGRINTRILPELAAPEILPGDPTPTLAPTSTKEPTLAPAATDAPPAAETSAPEEAATESILLPVVVGETEAVKEPAPKTWLWGGIIGAGVVAAAVWIWRSRKKRP